MRVKYNFGVRAGARECVSGHEEVSFNHVCCIALTIACSVFHVTIVWEKHAFFCAQHCHLIKTSRRS